tara:strand:+ start:126 stop:995 length:870 start_codon:yes stop_codon:yes gene_type:complete
LEKISLGINSKIESVNILSVSKNKNFKKLYQIIFQKLFNKKRIINDKFVFENINKIENTDLRKNHELMIKIEVIILSLLKDLKIKNVESLQFPANIRITSSSDFFYKKKEYDTRYVHCDAWSGAPKDSYNCFIYLYISKNAPSLELYHSLPNNHSLKNYAGSYHDAKIEKKLLKKKNMKNEKGTMAIWETYTPHKTKIQKMTSTNSYRVSIDFRYKSSSPYLEKPHKQKNFYTTKMNSDGVYWFVKNNYSGFTNLNKKIKYELSKISKNKTMSNLRKKYLDKFYYNEII